MKDAGVMSSVDVILTYLQDRYTEMGSLKESTEGTSSKVGSMSIQSLSSRLRAMLVLFRRVLSQSTLGNLCTSRVYTDQLTHHSFVHFRNDTAIVCMTSP